MGIVINYSGTMNDMAQIDGLIADVREFCEKAGWPFDEVADPISGVALMTPEDFMGGRSRKKTNRNNWPEEDVFRKGGMTIFFDSKNPILLEETLRGIMAHPPGTDSLMLTFDGKGRLCNYSPLPQDCVRGRLRDLTHYFCFPLFCKTTGETEQHMAICLLLRMLRDRYIKDLKVDDETGFFKSVNACDSVRALRLDSGGG